MIRGIDGLPPELNIGVKRVGRSRYYTCQPAPPEEQMSGSNALRRRFRVAVASVAAASLASLATTALGATCPPVQVAIGSADVAFVGTMAAVDSAGTQATFAVEEVWKGGDLPTEVEVIGLFGLQWTDPSMAGARYLVLADVVAGGLQVGGECNQVSLWDPSMAEARPATAHPPAVQDAELDLPIPLILIGGVILLVAAVSAFAFRSSPKTPE
jgi:hypothetical protein